MLGSFQQLIVLVRHGQAMKTEDDPARPLSVTGRQQAERMAGLLSELGPSLDEVRHSGKARARQTAEIFAGQLGLKPAQIREVPGIAPNDDPEPVAVELESGRRSIMTVAHLPFLAKLASRLLAGDPDRVNLRFAEAGVVVLARVSGGWQLVAVLSQEMF